jgi:hypothetical protein
MKLAAAIARSFQASMRAELRAIENAVASGTKNAGRGLKTGLRRQVTSAGLGQRLANSWRDKHYPNENLDAASLVYSKAPQIIRAFDEGALIRAKLGRFLAIPTENAPRRGIDRKQIARAVFPSNASDSCGWCRERKGHHSLSSMVFEPPLAGRPAACAVSERQVTGHGVPAEV